VCKPVPSVQRMQLIAKQKEEQESKQISWGQSDGQIPGDAQGPLSTYRPELNTSDTITIDLARLLIQSASQTPRPETVSLKICTPNSPSAFVWFITKC